jgi:hypothetical protein
MAIYCMACGTELPDEASFCWKCGKPQKSGLQTDEGQSEICEIRLASRQRWGGLSYSCELEAVVLGPKGQYIIASRSFGMNPYFAEWESNRKFRAEREVLVNQLLKDGWQPLPSAINTEGITLPRFRRKV